MAEEEGRLGRKAQSHHRTKSEVPPYWCIQGFCSRSRRNWCRSSKSWRPASHMAAIPPKPVLTAGDRQSIFEVEPESETQTGKQQGKTGSQALQMRCPASFLSRVNAGWRHGAKSQLEGQ
ncbi:MAG: hypothetical protein P8130_08370 [Deltaproteobacteria bacterium]